MLKGDVTAEQELEEAWQISHFRVEIQTLNCMDFPSCYFKPNLLTERGFLRQQGSMKPGRL